MHQEPRLFSMRAIVALIVLPASAIASPACTYPITTSPRPAAWVELGAALDQRHLPVR